MKSVVIVGGLGKMGTWFARFFRRHHCRVHILDLQKDLPVSTIQGADAVLISVPIDKTLSVIQSIAPHVKKTGLLMDLTSVKEEPVTAMLNYSKSQVLGTHPLFGPHFRSMKNQSIILCPARGSSGKKWFISLLKSEGADVIIDTATNHDKMMALIQGVIHFSSITFCHALKDLGISVKDSLNYSSPLYRLRLDISSRILNQDPNLYADIELRNKHIPKALKTYLNTSQKLFSIVNKTDTKGFVSYFNSAKKYFGTYPKKAEEYTNSAVDYLANKK